MFWLKIFLIIGVPFNPDYNFNHQFLKSYVVFLVTSRCLGANILSLTKFLLLFKDWIVLVYVIGHLIDVIKDVYQQGRTHFFSSHWNYLAVASVTTFVLHYVIWWTGRSILTDDPQTMKWESHAHDRGYATMLVSYCVFSVAILLAFAQNLSFIQANSNTGPLLQAFIRMLIDAAKFFLYFIFVFVAFAVSFAKLYLQYDKARQHFKLNKSGANQSDPLHLERCVKLTAVI